MILLLVTICSNNKMLEVFQKENTYVIGVDEVGRGPMFGRVYAAAVILPDASLLPDASFNHELMKDSKKFTSSKKLKETADYIKKNCIAYSIMLQYIYIYIYYDVAIYGMLCLAVLHYNIVHYSTCYDITS